MNCSRPLLLSCLLATVLATPLAAQDPFLKDSLKQAQTLWASQGDREAASAKFLQIKDALEPKAKSLDPEWQQVLCETYNWLAVLDDRSRDKKANAPKYLESMLDLNPDFEVDRNVTSARLQKFFDDTRGAKFCRLKLSVDPVDGVLSLDGKARPVQGGVRYLLPGSHVVLYTRSGYQSAEQQLELAPREVKNLDIKLNRISSTVTLYTAPTGAEIFLDGKRLGASRGQAGPELRPLADKIGLQPEQMSAAFVIGELPSGQHILELRSGCYRTRRIELDPSYAAPYADHILEPYKLEPSRGSLTVTSTAPGGELFLSGKSFGPIPVKDLQVCSGTYDLQVRFASGGFSQQLEIPDGKQVSVVARPKPRMVFLGLVGNDDFTGRDRLLGQLENLGQRLKTLAYIAPPSGEKAEDALARLKSTKDAELFLIAKPVPGKPIHEVELIVSTLTGEEDHLAVKPLEQDPLGSLAERLNALPSLWEPSVGITLVDLPGEAGPVVIKADEAALKAGVKLLKPLLQANGKSVGSVAAFRKILQEGGNDRLAVSQGDIPIAIAVSLQALEIPVNASNLCYPSLLAELRLRYLGAKGDEAGLLRLNQALALMHFRRYDKAMEVLRDARLISTQGVSQGTLDYYTGICLLRLGNAYISEAIQSFNQALKYPGATLFGPDGPLLAPMAKQALEDLKL